jgi:hypothetical protein
MQGSYHVGNTASRPISEVKQRWALLVLTWETSLEPRVTLRFCTLFSANKVLAHARGPVILQATPHLNSRRIVLPRQVHSQFDISSTGLLLCISHPPLQPSIVPRRHAVRVHRCCRGMRPINDDWEGFNINASNCLARGFTEISMSCPQQQFDFIVIGCGSGGSACADRALNYGAKVCLIERGYAPNQKRIHRSGT